MKRVRSGYVDSDEARAAKVFTFIQSLRLSIPLNRLCKPEAQTRRECPSCHRRRLFYCYDCLTVVHPDTHPPPLHLPLQVYVLLHAGELRSKSTSLAAATISPDIHIVHYPTVPDHLSREDTLLLYPSDDSVELCDVPNLVQYKNVVFIESTWQKSRAVVRDERVAKFRHVRIKSQTSLFWRFQNNDPSYLATVEAIYYLLREYIIQRRRQSAISEVQAKGHNIGSTELAKRATGPTLDVTHEVDYHGEVDDLLYYYVHQYIAIQERYTRDTKAKYTDRHFDGYILKSIDWHTLFDGSPMS